MGEAFATATAFAQWLIDGRGKQRILDQADPRPRGCGLPGGPVGRGEGGGLQSPRP